MTGYRPPPIWTIAFTVTPEWRLAYRKRGKFRRWRIGPLVILYYHR